MPALQIAIVTFNGNEARAIDAFLDDLLTAGSSWSRSGQSSARLKGDREIALTHFPLRAQGNVVAAAQVAALFKLKTPPEFVVFYGCAGALDPSDVGSAFLVRSVSYASLGTVVQCATSPQNERVTLKNKWLCVVDGSDVDPLPSLSLRGGTVAESLDLAQAAALTPAHVVATDKVLRVSASPSAPIAAYSGPPAPRYAKAEWTYGEMLAFVKTQGQGAILVEMESYGIATVADALTWLDRVLIVRIATDDLTGHASSDSAQRDLLMEGRKAVASLIHALLFPERRW